ncbi:amidohydrolase [Mycolicibacterium wolinskyi]|uniref:amidohydrolase n=1 Tax=Mycolicibacterium TaxID=1866885 RepID=UPI000B09DD89|nr:MULTISPECIES: amidohydrolase [Mycolicibacterium]MCV7289122.1 amidohydrolase [Mycolicibacterium wolinskyi]MCV7297285.1 amidohydrolase [Mycolicibacterium goodii]
MTTPLTDAAIVRRTAAAVAVPHRHRRAATTAGTWIETFGVRAQRHAERHLRRRRRTA